MATFPQWEYDLLKALGAPSSPNNLAALNLWAQSEGSVTNNPLATSGQGAGASKCVAQCGSSSPIYEYDTEANGVAQMSSFLKGSYYTAIVRAFQQDAGLAAIYQAINSSPWCKGCQNGRYPIALANQVSLPGSQSTNPTVGTGQASSGSGGGSSGGSGSSLQDCVIKFPGLLFLSGPCILTKGGVKWLSGMAALVVGTGLGMFGVVVLAAYGFDASGARRAVTRTAGALPTPVGRAIRATGGGSRSRNVSRGTSSRGSLPTAGRRESREIDRRYAETVRQQGPIGPRGGTSQASREFRSRPGYGRGFPEQRQRIMRPTGPRSRTPGTPAE